MTKHVKKRLRVHFTADDLARVRVAAGPDPMWETVLSMHLLQTQRGAGTFCAWRQVSQSQLGSSVRRLLALNPAVGSFPDFLTPAGGTIEFEAGIDAMLSTPRTRLCAELGALPDAPRTRSWRRSVAASDPDAMAELGRLFRSYFQTVVAPLWGDAVAKVETERGRLARAFLDGGPVSVLTSLNPHSRWRPPVLEFDYPVNRDLHLDGRGLLIIPSYFCWRDPVTLTNSALPPVLVCPLPEPGPVRLCRSPGGDQELSALLGLTRAAVLRAAEQPCTTTELARRAGTSVTSASQHATVLRRSGLITSVRHGGTVVHSLTGLGSALLAGPRP